MKAYDKALIFQNVSFSIGKHPILQNVSFSIPKGEWVVIAGPNGSGKSTIVKLAAGIWKKNKGRIIIDGKEQEKYSAKELAHKLSVLTHEFSPLYNIKVFDFVKLGTYAKTDFTSFYSKNYHEDVVSAIEKTGIKNLLNKGIKELSMGELQRVRLAKILAQNTPIIILDEPLAHLDINYKIWAIKLFRYLKSSGKTLITVLHDFMFTYSYPDRFILIKDGKIVFNGKKERKDGLIHAFSRTFSVNFQEKTGFLLPF